MSLGQALSSAVSGLRVTQSGLSLVAANIANAETPGYVRKTATQVAATSGNISVGVRLASINRELNQYLQRQLRTETSGGSYQRRARLPSALQGILGERARRCLETVFNNLVSAARSSQPPRSRVVSR